MRKVCEKCGTEIGGWSNQRKGPFACWCIRSQKARERILADSYVNERGCWEWLGSRLYSGYADMSIVRGCKRIRLGHVISYLLFIGAIPEGHELDHLCKNRCCVNPWHLQPKTHIENTRAGGNAIKQFCKYGHPFTPENTYSPPCKPTMRQCRECARTRKKQYKTS